MSALPSRLCTLTDQQLLRCREHLETWAALAPKDRDAFAQTVTREVWLMENPDYNWTACGRPAFNADTTYYWTRNRVLLLLSEEGTKDLRHAVDNSERKNWKGQDVFNAECCDIIKESIFEEHPDLRDDQIGWFSIYRHFKAKVYAKLTAAQKEFFEKRAEDWNKRGVSTEQKEKNAKINLTKWCKGMTHKGVGEFGRYFAFIVLPEPGVDGEPEIIDFFQELGYAKEPLRDWVNWDSLLARLKEYVHKAHTEVQGEQAQEPEEFVNLETTQTSKKKPKGSKPSGIPLEVDLERQCIVLPTELWKTNPGVIQRHEEALLKEILQKAFALAKNSNTPTRVPWTEIGKAPQDFFPEELSPPDHIVWKFAGDMSVAHRLQLLEQWFEVGWVRVNMVKRGKARVSARTATAAPNASGASGPGTLTSELAASCGLVNRYGSRGHTVLGRDQLLPDCGDDDALNSLVFEDDILDPAELERTEDEQHAHLAPCVVPHTSEARAQYCMTALQLVPEGRDRTLAEDCVRGLMTLPSAKRDGITDAQIARHASTLVPPAAITWDATSPLLPDDSVVGVRAWLALKPYLHKGFLGWSQGWKVMLAMVMFLVSEASREINRHELAESEAWCIVSGELSGASGLLDFTSGRDALSDAFNAFLTELHILNRKAWPGVAPSCRYRFAHSRSGYITRICQARGMADLVHLVSYMPDLPLEEDDKVPDRTFGSWEWGRCGLTDEYHNTQGKWEELAAQWTETDVFIRDGCLISREAALTWLLRIALAWTDYLKLDQMDRALLPGPMQESVMNVERTRHATVTGIKRQIESLKPALQDTEIPLRPHYRRKDFMLPDRLREDVTRAIMRLRETDKPQSEFQRRIWAAQEQEANFRAGILRNIEAARAHRKRLAQERQNQGQSASAGPRRQAKTKVGPVLPVLPLTQSLPRRPDQIQPSSPPPEEAAPSTSRSSKAPRHSRKSNPTSSARTKSTTSRSRGRSGASVGTSKHVGKSKQVGISSGTRRASLGRPRKGHKRRTPDEEETSDSELEEFNIHEDTDEEDEQDSQEEDVIPEPPPKPRPRPRPVVPQPGRKTTPVNNEASAGPASGDTGEPDGGPSAAGTERSSAFEVRTVKRTRSRVEVLLDSPRKRRNTSAD
ncbi:unnamed protein product [Peniophora sp. CBMAI 1063]|nr:unnamed protein product [Peniophora sp. CBMAI 1063]